nr:TonB-dependent receptor [Bacteroidaceae bacterium]
QVSWKMNPINDLSAGLTLNLIPNLSLYGKVNILLNREYDECYAYAGKGINFIGGLLFRF